MLKRIFLAMGLVISLTGPVWAEAPVGDWQAVGHNAGDQREYRGNVSVVKSGTPIRSCGALALLPILARV